TKYYFDPIKARKLLSEANLKDKDNDGLLDIKPIIFKISAGDNLNINIAKAIQEDLRQVGLPVTVEILEFQTLLLQLQKGQYQMTMARWVGGNQDPLFLYDLFVSTEIPTETRFTRNRSRYSNKKIDDLLTQALNEANNDKAKNLFIKTQEVISEDVPLLPLWYPSLLILANEKVIGIKANDGTDLSFVKDIFKVQ
ncbi:MAG TPA: ABC transporter substrate-binding protein, partial [Pyrinomonadaceae bacterium]|nr:ABC transporter substrate-binding protein [Pyrinomonadaceae bacterium]